MKLNAWPFSLMEKVSDETSDGGPGGQRYLAIAHGYERRHQVSVVASLA
jgi:hypothetical protein